MGSFTSARKILNEDTQDDDVVAQLAEWGDTGKELDSDVWRSRLMEKCREEMATWPDLLPRRWKHVRDCGNNSECLTRREDELGNGVDVDRVRRESGSQRSAFRLMQWNVLSQGTMQHVNLIS